jgi:hypothetical protein
MSKSDDRAEFNAAAPRGVINLRSHSLGTGSGGIPSPRTWDVYFKTSCRALVSEYPK